MMFKFFFGWPIGLPATFAVAVLSYYCVERPFLRRRAASPKPLVRVPQAAQA
jgi:peptidoglycan/LPS O-acetylase OafA/YrhL